MINHKLFKGVLTDYKINTINVDKGYLLFSEGEECQNVYLIISGGVNISTLTLNGKEYQINSLSDNDIFGDVLLFSKDRFFLGDGIVTTKSEIAIINKNEFLELLKDPIILNNYLEYSATRNMEMRTSIKLLSQNSIRDRILFYLQSETKRIKSNVAKIKSKEILAKKLNLERPSLSRELANMKRDNIIDYDKYSITLLNKKRL